MNAAPLAGVRIVDLTRLGYGAQATTLCGCLGAEVLRVESRTRPCLSRIDVQVGASRAGNLDDKPWFAHLNTSKLSLSLDLKQPGSRELLEPLIDWADVVVGNFSPGTLEKLGLDQQQFAIVFSAGAFSTLRRRSTSTQSTMAPRPSRPKGPYQSSQVRLSSGGLYMTKSP